MQLYRKSEIIILILILLLSLFLNLFLITQEGYGNTYYSATVKSMLKSFKNFFFVSFDTNGFVAVDKPPLGLWIQAVFALIFGFSGFSVILPCALAGTLSVFLVYKIVKYIFNSSSAALIAALVLSISPISVAISRNNTMDSILIAFLLWASYIFLKGLDKKSFRMILFSAIILGLSFNIKMMQAFIILPSFVIVYLFFNKINISKKIIRTFIVAFVLIIVSLSWAIIIDLTPAQNRPYVGGTNTNSVMELAIAYNGIFRTIEPPYGYNFYAETGKPGWFRLFNKYLGGQISWFIPLALIGAIAYLLYSISNSSFDMKKKQGLVFFSSWFLIFYLYLNLNTGLFHIHYISMIAPSVAVLCSIGVVALVKLYFSNKILKWMLPATVVISVIIQVLLANYFPKWNSVFVYILIIISVLTAGYLFLNLLLKHKFSSIPANCIIVLCFMSQLIIPTAWAITPILYRGDPGTPYARPDLKTLKTSAAYFWFEKREKQEYKELLSFLKENHNNEKYILGVNSALFCGSDLVLYTNGRIMNLGGFIGLDPIVPGNKVSKYVESKEIRFFLMRYGLEMNSWIAGNGKVVSNKLWKEPGDLQGYVLYDLKPP